MARIGEATRTRARAGRLMHSWMAWLDEGRIGLQRAVAKGPVAEAA